jgi:GNAT superfamily N-acetyltransferase
MIEAFGPDDGARMANFAAVRERVGYPTPDEPVQPPARCLLAWGGHGIPAARLSFAVAEDLRGAPGRTGLIGHYESTDPDAAAVLLRDAVVRLRGAGVDRILGPLNGSTWGRYRLALPPEPREDVEPPFLSEPTNPADYPADFQGAGFRVAATYESAIVEDLSQPDPRRDALAERARARGVTIRPLDPDRFDAELMAIHALSVAAFADNLFYSPIGFAEFQARYTPLRPLLDPELVRMAEDAEGRLLGFVFAFPDLLTMRDGRPTRVVLKTLATAQAARGLGLGTLLTDEVRRLAHEKGYASVIHALMQADNASVNISRHSARVFRRYALYGWGMGG